MSVQRLLRVVCLLAGLLAAPCVRADDMPYRFAVLHPSERGRLSMGIYSVQQPILDNYLGEQRFHVTRVPTKPILTFSPGLQPVQGGGTVRFEIILKTAKGKTSVLYSKELSEPGWTNERIDLSDRDLAGAEFLFRRVPLSGESLARIIGAHWGNPMLVSGVASKRPSVIVVSLDTLRADRLGAYGYPQARTPFLDAFARSGVVYDRAYSPSTWTVPSHASLFFGLHLPTTVSILEQKKLLPADAALPNRPLASILQDAGYLTAGFTGGGFLSWAYDFPRGHDTFLQYSYGTKAPTECLPNRFDGPEVFRRAAEWLRANGTHPFYLFVHTYDVHDRCPFITPGTSAWEGWSDLTPERNQELLAYYDRLIAETDQRMGALLATLDELKLKENTLVVITSDHGDAFEEHGQRSHGCRLKPYEELSRVPLMVRYPPRAPAGTRVPQPVSLIDVAPTVLAVLGLPPEAWMRGGVLPGLNVIGSRIAPTVYTQCGDILAVHAGSDKLITSRSQAFPDEVYDLTADPREAHNLATTDGKRAENLRHIAAEYWKTAISDTPAAAAPHPEQIDDATKERLRALGYVE
jgi:arylsulfatase A-like enzyme